MLFLYEYKNLISKDYKIKKNINDSLVTKLNEKQLDLLVSTDPNDRQLKKIIQSLSEQQIYELEFLDLSGLQITDLSPLARCNNIRSLNLINSNIKDISPLASCIKLEYILINSNIIYHKESELIKSIINSLTDYNGVNSEEKLSCWKNLLFYVLKYSNCLGFKLDPAKIMLAVKNKCINDIFGSFNKYGYTEDQETVFKIIYPETWVREGKELHVCNTCFTDANEGNIRLNKLPDEINLEILDYINSNFKTRIIKKYGGQKITDQLKCFPRTNI